MPASTSRQPLVGIVSVTYNRCEPLLLLLSQLKTIAYPPECFDIFLVDNASTDDTVERVSRAHQEVKLIRSDENTGTSAGFNLGMQRALTSERQYDYIWLLDSDAEVEAETLPHLIASFEADPAIGIIGSTVYDPDKRDHLVACGLHVHWHNGTVSLNKKLAAAVNNLADVDLIPACSLLIRARLCRELGLWDERFWLYWGDTDWCQRVVKNGYRVCCHTRSRVWHRDWANTRRGFGSPVSLYDDLRGAILFNLRHNQGSLAGTQRLVLKSYIRAALEHLTMRPNFSDACDAAARDFLVADFKRSNLYVPHEPITPEGIEQIFRHLRKILPEKPRFLVAQLQNQAAEQLIKEAVTKNFPGARLEEKKSVRISLREDFTTDYRHYLHHELTGFFLTLFKPRRHVLITDIGAPHLNNLLSARHTIFVDSSGRGVICRNRPLPGLVNMIKMLVKGLKTAYMDLPGIVKNNPAVQRAVTDYSVRHKLLLPTERAADTA